ncbi:hypothetical protein [Mesorhizobium sp. LNJC405B00]|uniref:hypothetical protein n=1 Tax=Mesorhizobium sp. LNJC405B00 TaxID=1287281 RepID=UPI0018DB7C69|nr:hypothetical protein [Mesorhizobium sp. LNJC405B00]
MPIAMAAKMTRFRMTSPASREIPGILTGKACVTIGVIRRLCSDMGVVSAGTGKNIGSMLC